MQEQTTFMKIVCNIYMHLSIVSDKSIKCLIYYLQVLLGLCDSQLLKIPHDQLALLQSHLVHLSMQHATVDFHIY